MPNKDIFFEFFLIALVCPILPTKEWSQFWLISVKS